MIIKVLKADEISIHLKSQIIDFINTCFHSDQLGQKVYSRNDIEKIILALEGNVIVGHAIIINRTVIHKSNTYHLAGLGVVCTDPSERSKGVGTRVVEQVNVEINKGNYDVGLLFCHPKLESFYGRTGWIKKTEGTILFSENNEERYERTSYILPIKGKESLVNDWLNDTIHIGERSW